MKTLTKPEALDETAMAHYLAHAKLEFTRYEFEEDTSSKFWEIATNDTEVTTRWGRIGTYGRAQTKSYPTRDAATRMADRQSTEKEDKGYELVEATDLGETIGEFLERIGMWSHPGLVPLGNGKADFEDPWECVGTQSWWVDGEDMAEGDMESVLEEMSPSLSRVGLELSVVTVMGPHSENSTGYDLLINEVPVEMYRTDPSNPKLPLCDDPWRDCSVKPLAVVNELLGMVGSIYRLGLINPGGNDGLAVLLPYDILVRFAGAEIEEEFVIP